MCVLCLGVCMFCVLCMYVVCVVCVCVIYVHMHVCAIIERVYTRKKEHGKHKNDPDLENAKKEYREIFFRFAR